ncbi:MAG: hypothetical protein J6T40_05325 [Clostridiales bacterium]|nr:hypothetical protein [Clostridiales bacterium]
MAEMICSLCNAKMEYDSFTSAYVCQVCGHSVSAKNAEAEAPASEPVSASATSPATAFVPEPALSPEPEPAPAPIPAPEPAPAQMEAPASGPTPMPIPSPVLPFNKPAGNSEGAELIRQVKVFMADQKYENAADVLSVLNKRKIQFASLYPQTFLLTLLCGYQANSIGEIFSKIGKNGYALKKLVDRPGWMEFTKALELENREFFPDVFEYCVICCAFSGEADLILGRKSTPATSRVHIPDSSDKRKNAFEVALATTMTRLAGGEDLVPRSIELFKRIKTIEEAILA